MVNGKKETTYSRERRLMRSVDNKILDVFSVTDNFSSAYQIVISDMLTQEEVRFLKLSKVWSTDNPLKIKRVAELRKQLLMNEIEGLLL